jgi:TonB family protein
VSSAGDKPVDAASPVRVTPPTPNSSTPADSSKAGENPAVAFDPPTLAVVVKRVVPSYPVAARMLGIKGTVVLDVDVDEKGAVVRAVATSGPAALRPAAEEALKRWQFKPATRDGKGMRSKASISIVFSPWKSDSRPGASVDGTALEAGRNAGLTNSPHCQGREENRRSDEMIFNEEQKRKYEATRQMVKDEIERFDRELAEEVIRAKHRIEELQQAKKAAKQIHDAACALLGVKSVIEMKDYEIAELEKQVWAFSPAADPRQYPQHPFS